MLSKFQITELKKYLSVSVFLFVLFHLLTVFKGDNGDTWCWIEWGKAMYKNGLGAVYHSPTDYLPLFHYFLYIYVSFHYSLEAVSVYIEYFKIVPLIFHFIAGYYVLMLIKKDRNENHGIRKTLFYLLNVAVLYNAIVWGQMDIILTSFVLMSYYFAVKEEVTPSLIFLVAALNFKLQAVIFIPPLGLMLLPLMVKDFSFERLMKWIFLPLTFQISILLPYYMDGSLDRIWTVTIESFGKFPRISLNAYNLWHFFFPDLTMNDPDTERFAGMTYKTWGLILFCIASFFALFPFLKNLSHSLKSKTYIALPLNKTLLIFALIPLLFFYLNTEMHERYSHPCLIFIIIYGIRTNRPILPFMASWCYFFNLEGVLKAFQLENYGTVIFHPVFISALWFLVIIGLFLNLYDLGPNFSITQKHVEAVRSLMQNLGRKFRPLLNSTNKIAKWKSYLVLSVIVGIILHLLTPTRSHGWDTHCWIVWATSMYKLGLENVYAEWNEYMPLFQYFLKAYTMFQSGVDTIEPNIRYFKLESLLFHLISGYFVVLLIRKNNQIKNPVLKSLYYLLNIAVLYNGLLWGQVDIILTAFLVMSYYFAVEQKITLALVLFLAAINFKIHAIIFIPPLGLMLLPLMIRDFSWRKLSTWIFVPLVFQTLILAPYIYSGQLEAIWGVVMDSFGRYKFVSLNAYNFWYLVIPDLNMKTSDEGVFLGLIYKHWGLILFFLSSGLALFPLLKSTFLSLRQRKYIELSVDKSLLIFALLPFLFFYFNTEMHERYSHPGLIFVTIWGIRNRQFILPFLTSIAYFSNLDNVLSYDNVLTAVQFPNNRPFFYQPPIVSLIWLASIMGLFMELYDLKPEFVFSRKSKEAVAATQ